MFLGVKTERRDGGKEDIGEKRTEKERGKLTRSFQTWQGASHWQGAANRWDSSPGPAKLRASKGTRLGGCACNPSLREAGNEGSWVGLEANLSYTVRICLTIAPS